MFLKLENCWAKSELKVFSVMMSFWWYETWGCFGESEQISCSAEGIQWVFKRVFYDDLWASFEILNVLLIFPSTRRLFSSFMFASLQWTVIVEGLKWISRFICAQKELKLIYSCDVHEGREKAMKKRLYASNDTMKISWDVWKFMRLGCLVFLMRIFPFTRSRDSTKRRFWGIFMRRSNWWKLLCFFLFSKMCELIFFSSIIYFPLKH